MGGDPQDRAASPRPRCIALRQFLSTVPCSLFPVPDFCKKSYILAILFSSV
ncbi:hypothetical protein [Moorena producens]|uniref:hypothetical protein n=1 Tax=Moorena producens TaxID=1155739 RepID=UPI003C71C928